ncbi:MAG: HAD family hydrolase [Candidatus Acidiferrum sp.]
MEAKEAEKRTGSVTAFFDLDGTLIHDPSLEKRFVRILRLRNAIGIANYFLWLAEAARLAPRGINQILHANKMYLRGVCVAEPWWMNIPPFYPEAIERVAWHAEHGHLIVIMSGTLDALAEKVARELEAELGTRGLRCNVRVCATRLEERGERWTGRIVGEAMFCEAKARAVRQAAADAALDLQRCFAYGDSAKDRWMLETVGKPTAVNPSHDLERIARRNDWPVLRWEEEKDSTQRTQRTQSSQRKPATQVARQSDGPEEIHRGTRASCAGTEHGT